MIETDEILYVPAEILLKFTEQVFAVLGTPPEDACICAEVLVASDLRGISLAPSRGFGFRLAWRGGNEINRVPDRIQDLAGDEGSLLIQEKEWIAARVPA